MRFTCMALRPVLKIFLSSLVHSLHRVYTVYLLFAVDPVLLMVSLWASNPRSTWFVIKKIMKKRKKSFLLTLSSIPSLLFNVWPIFIAASWGLVSQSHIEILSPWIRQRVFNLEYIFKICLILCCVRLVSLLDILSTIKTISIEKIIAHPVSNVHHCSVD